ncbi:hypothetical protein Misp06_01563 [Microbulbifer sp. NBRC 101763]|uniref:hypothetical protein n=1 Tax=Microbulbifer TaxID=48073 RepID=UPI000379F511|nr:MULTISPECIES: hypothetical protein [Microbulbifer]WHI51917.1 hypothetical protein P3339_03550 [Microbulbifer sp. MLAF003]
MHKSQLYFGASVGLLVMFVGWTLTLAGIVAGALMAVGLLVLLANVGYWFTSRSRRRIRVDIARQERQPVRSQRRKY